MGGDKGETCDIYKDQKDMLTYFSRVVLFDITGFYQWLVNLIKLEIEFTNDW